MLLTRGLLAFEQYAFVTPAVWYVRVQYSLISGKAYAEPPDHYGR